ncbi:MAG: right-handed parallel beta-helix repeat-containing protein [Chitinivibrionales bacterium]|nr:right-handed parallel beta-helix repeat-containing protein [Chitinivibrionales bacterium]
MHSCVFKNNHPAFKGGAIHYENGSHLRITRSLFMQDTADYGGGISLQNCHDIRIDSCTFMQIVGGAMLVSTSSDLTITNGCQFIGNSAAAGGSLNLFYSDSVRITRSVFRQNSAYNGGAIFSWGSTLVIDHSDMRGNIAEDAASVLYGIEGSFMISASRFTANGVGRSGCMVYLQNMQISCDSCQFIGNEDRYCFLAGRTQGSIKHCLIDNENTAIAVDTVTDAKELVIHAAENWWGDSSGPYHAMANKAGLGDTVTDVVECVPWLKNPQTSISISSATKTPKLHSIEASIRQSALNMVFTTAAEKGLRLSLYNSKGQAVLTRLLHLPRGVMHVQCSLPQSLPGGIYFLIVGAQKATIVHTGL